MMHCCWGRGALLDGTCEREVEYFYGLGREVCRDHVVR